MRDTLPVNDDLEFLGKEEFGTTVIPLLLFSVAGASPGLPWASMWSSSMGRQELTAETLRKAKRI